MVEKLVESEKILVADDDSELIRYIQSVLEGKGYCVITAKDGKEAYKLLQSGQTFSAAIFDVAMPHIGGRELVDYMKNERRLMKIPVIIMTAEINFRYPSDSISRGAVAFLPKPFTDVQLTTMLSMFVKPAGHTKHNKEKV
jgi:CheY-like chemotaxis protein